MMDMTIEFHKILMRRKAGSSLIIYDLPHGYTFVCYLKGDEKFWAEIEHSVKEFKTKKAAGEYFKENYKLHVEELERRCFFIEDAKGKKIATLTIWWEYIGARRFPWVSWVAVMPEHQGKGLGKALVSKGMEMCLEIEGDSDVYLKTQTPSYKAVNIYKEQGFDFVKEKTNSGWDIEDYDKMMSVLKEHLR